MDFETSKHWLFVVSGFRISPEPASCTLNSCQAEYQHHAATEPGLMAPRGPSGSLWPSPRTTPSRSAPRPGGCWIPPRTSSTTFRKETNTAFTESQHSFLTITLGSQGYSDFFASATQGFGDLLLTVLVGEAFTQQHLPRYLCSHKDHGV